MKTSKISNIKKLTIHQKINYRSWFKENGDNFFMRLNRAYDSFGYSDNDCFTSVNSPHFKSYMFLSIRRDSDLAIKLK
jgi:hypothetical protein